jgi:uncharacterized SAM-binding protein YcdF (DUF218 family)
MVNPSIYSNHRQALARIKGNRVSGLRRYCAIMLALAALIAGAWIEREAALQGAANLWILSDPMIPGDAAVVLGGGIDVRPYIAADLYAKGLVKKILISKVEEGPALGIGVLAGHTELNRKALSLLGVPESAIETFGNANRNTWEEALALKEWADRNAPSVLIIPTEAFAARRVRWTFRRRFAGTSVRLVVPSVDPPYYNHTIWWKSEGGVIAFQNELLKYLYYRLNY